MGHPGQAARVAAGQAAGQINGSPVAWSAAGPAAGQGKCLAGGAAHSRLRGPWCVVVVGGGGPQVTIHNAFSFFNNVADTAKSAQSHE